MNQQEIFSHIDHTLLKATASWQDIDRVCGEAVRFGAASACIPPTYVSRARQAYPGLNVCTVIGFPLGYHTTESKAAEAGQALADGAGEIDMVINLGDVKNGDLDKVTREIAAIKALCGARVLKVIVETCYLTEREKIALCKAVTEGNADFIKTSTGFGTAGAAIGDIHLFREHIGPGVRIKAAGGVKAAADLVMFLEAGCQRIGTSSAIALLAGEAAGSY